MEDQQTEPPADQLDALRIAIVGCGPRGLFCLERLSARLSEIEPLKPIAILIFEPFPFPGAGNIYDPRQPQFLRMNFAAKYVDAWLRPSSRGDELNLTDWLARAHPQLAQPNAFLPRSVVGEYLHDCYQIVESRLRAFASITVFPRRIEQIARRGDQWCLKAEQHETLVDEVLLTVGHEGWQSSPTRRFVSVFPINQLTDDRVAPASTVAVRGFGLTWIDAALALTEGRGGSFSETDRWHYSPSGREPARLIPYSRTGRPMLAKPDESVFPQEADLKAIWGAGQEQIQQLPVPIQSGDGIDRLWRVFTASAAKALRISGMNQRDVTSQCIANWFDQWCCTPMSGADTRSVMRQSYLVATARSSPDMGWALGAAWRGLYPALVRQISHGGLSPDAWSEFRAIAVEMERVAFGPPAENLGRVLALVDAGLVDLRWLLHRPNYQTESVVDLCGDGKAPRFDHGIDAVIPAPTQYESKGPLAALLNFALIQRQPGPRAIQVDSSGSPIRPGATNTETHGLAILGRCTEGCILGNDSLSRTLHDHPSQWSNRIVNRIRKQVRRDVSR